MHSAWRLPRAMHMQRRDGRLLQQEINRDTERFAALHVDFVSIFLLNGMLNYHAWNLQERTLAVNSDANHWYYQSLVGTP